MAEGVSGMAGPGWGAVLWFLAIIAAIPVALWLFKRSPLGMAGSGIAGSARAIGMLPLAGGQRVVTVEVGQGEDRRWLVLGVTAQHISTLHTMAPQDATPATRAQSAANEPVSGTAPGFAALLGQFRSQLRGPMARPAVHGQAHVQSRAQALAQATGQATGQAPTQVPNPAPTNLPISAQTHPHAR